MTIRPATVADAAAVTQIYNQGIAGRGATFETIPRLVSELQARIADPQWPLLVLCADDGSVLGWAGLSGYRARACYAGIAEFSIYLERDARGRGCGRWLLDALIEAAARRGCWKLVSRIFTNNLASRALCQRCGFREVGTYEKHGRLDGQWRDVVIVERLIPVNLADGEPVMPPIQS